MNDKSVGTIGILAFPEDVEIAEPDYGEAEAAGKDVGVKFVHVIGDRI